MCKNTPSHYVEMYLGSLKFNIYSGKTVFKVELYAAFFMFVATTVVSIGEFMFASLKMKQI